MLDWLKTILGEAYTEDIDKKVSAEIGKGFVARADFNTLNEDKKALAGQLSDRDTQLEALRKVDAESLQAEITRLQGENTAQAAQHKQELASMRRDAAVERALTGARAKHLTAARALLADFLGKAEVGEDGAVKGLDDEIQKLVKGKDTAFLFEPAKPKVTLAGAAPADTPQTPPGGEKPDPAKMTYDDFAALMEAGETS